MQPVPANMRDRLFGHPDRVGEEAVVRQSREVPVAGRDPWRRRRVANDHNLEALLQKMTQVRLDAEVCGHPSQHDLRDAALSQLQRQVVALRAPYLVWRGDDCRPIEDELLELLEEVGAGPRQALNSQWPRAFEHVEYIQELLGWARESPFPVSWIVVVGRDSDSHAAGLGRLEEPREIRDHVVLGDALTKEWPSGTVGAQEVVLGVDHHQRRPRPVEHESRVWERLLGRDCHYCWSLRTWLLLSS